MGPSKRNARHFQQIFNQIEERTCGWQSKLLSDAGRLVLIKHVQCSIHIHILSATNVVNICLKRIDTILANFFWGKSDYGKKKHWMNWSNLCLPTDAGRLGLHNLRDIRRAFILKKCVASS